MTIYGRGAKAIATAELNRPVWEVQQLQNNFFATVPKYHKWYKAIRAEVLEKGVLRTPFDRVRRWSLITPDNMVDIQNEACNFPIQSIASDLCLTSMIKLHRELVTRGWGRACWSIHDSILFLLKIEHVAEARALIEQTMTTPPFQTLAIFEVKGGVGHNWADIH